ncbi:hypothetical protein JOF29_001117 [Kribbella aluminosa]|uniref:DUF1854 domain-containing protein n=1 Tax=Kribbella aluminosa TaxID=416017 RepID=A0ABS4UEN5_9ACTN|nr:hypothetical protein [Kribbella aluminosa]MBP2350034.1 hypothetical protein [Kribbella aluminosa]
MSEPATSSGPDSMLELTIRTAGAVRHAPRLMRAWMTGTEICVRDDAGMLVWLATPREVAWVHGGQLTESLALHDRDVEDIAVWEPATEVAALRTLRTATLWLGSDRTPDRGAGAEQLYERAVEWFHLPHPRFRNLRIARDLRTGTVLHISGTNSVYGDLLVEVTSLEVLPRERARFQTELQL